IFLELLKREQQLSLALLDRAGQPLSQPTQPGSATPKIAPFGAEALPHLPASHRNGTDSKREPRKQSQAEKPSERFDREQVAPRPQPAAPVPSPDSVLIEVVAEKTGYPADALALDLQLDADLGIDSIKRVEILSALQDRLPDLPAFEPERLGS